MLFRRPRRAHSRRHLRRAIAGGFAVAAALTLTACTIAEPAAKSGAQRDATLRIAVDERSLGQQVMGEIYAQALSSSERGATVDVVSGSSDVNQMDQLRGAYADLIVACTGDLLSVVNPQRADEIQAEIAAADEDLSPNDVSVNVEVYESLMRSLPSTITATDQSGATGCSDTDVPELSQNILPVFRSGVLDRDEVGLLDIYTKRVTTEELEELVAEAERTASVESVVSEWMGNAETESGSNLNQDSDSGEDESEFGF